MSGKMVQLVKKSLLTSLLVALSTLAYSQCTDDCVWPGDLNANGVVNALDALAIGFAIDATGPARADMSTDWQPLEADDWGQVLPSLGTDFKHIDADGDGLVEENDQFTISVNYERMNDNFTGYLGSQILGDDLFAVPSAAEFSPGQSILLDIHLGTAEQPIAEIYGIGFELRIDTQYVQDVFFDFSETWLGADEEVLSYGKYSGEFDHAGVALTRLDGNPVSGFGKIGQVEIVITDVILGLEADTTACLPFKLIFENVLGLNVNEQDLLITARPDSVNLKHPSQITGTTAISEVLNTVNIYPNPTSGTLHCQSLHAPLECLQLYDQLGRLVYREELPGGVFRHQLQLHHLPKGLYYLETLTPKDKAVQRLFVQ